MGTCFSIASALLDRVMTGRTDGSRRRILSTSREITSHIRAGPSDDPEYMHVTDSYEDVENDSVIICSPSAWRHVHTTNGNTEKQEEICTHQHDRRLEKVGKQRSDALHTGSQLGDMQKALTNSKRKLEASQRKVENLQHEVNGKVVLICELQAIKAELEETLRHSQGATEASAKEVQRLQADIEEKGKAVVDLETDKCQLVTKCQKLGAQLATIEQKNAQESLTSGSYADDHANPGMLEVACKGVDKATESLAKFLHDNSIAKSCPLDSNYLENFLCRLCPALPAEFPRAIHVRHAWGHWICLTMFRCFEHVYFDIDDMGLISSPLDFKNRALLCFQRFQHMKGMSPLDLHRESHSFRVFCEKKCGIMFPPWLLELAFYPKPPGDIVFGDFPQFNGHEEIWNRFLEVAKAVWLLHHVSFSFNPPATILRMARGIPYDKQFHDSVIPDENSDGTSQMVVLMTRPAFRLRNSIIRSRVLLSKKP